MIYTWIQMNLQLITLSVKDVFILRGDRGGDFSHCPLSDPCSHTCISALVALLHTYIFMFEETQHFQLPEHPLARNKVLEDIGHLFEGDSLSISGVCD